MCKFIGNWLYSIVDVAMETTEKSNFTCQSKSFISIFFNCQVSACELQPFSCYDLANDIFSQTAKTVFSHLKVLNGSLRRRRILTSVSNVCEAAPISLVWSSNGLNELSEVRFQ